MEHLDTIATVLGGMTLALALLSKWLERSPFPPSLVALALGVLLGPHVADVIDLREIGSRGPILEGTARLTLAVGLMGVALRIPAGYARRHWREMSVLIGLGMVLMWATSWLLMYWILGVPPWMAALLGALVTPTDPIAATPIVTGGVAERNVPERIRHAISFESGANDGLGYLFVFLAFLMLSRPQDAAIRHWWTQTLLVDVGVATAFGVALGYASGKLLLAAQRRGSISEQWRLIYTVALGLLAVGAGRLIGSDEVLVVFAAAMMFRAVVTREERAEEEHGQEAVNRFFSVPMFFVVGTAIPWEGWARLGTSGVALAIAILLLRRVPALLVMRPLLRDVRLADALFMGWFGPIAVAAVYYAALMESRLQAPLIWDVTSLVVVASVVVHGLTGAPLSKRYGRHSRGRTASGET